MLLGGLRRTLQRALAVTTWQKTFCMFCGRECEGPPGAELFTVFGGTNSGVELFF